MKEQAESKKGIDKKTLARFKKILLKEREEIVGEVKQIYESSKEMGQDGIQDIGDEAANIYNKQILLSLTENERIRLQEVDEALDRIENGTYGICEECGGPISPKRLEVRPVAKYCVPCLMKLEKGK
ncbi:MAG: TraR/DksA family transcriptional regulator [Syntrophaceae bacterium]|nr:TraR/DksA family transcriptional regulator [Syntrophaceae bacterium]